MCTGVTENFAHQPLERIARNRLLHDAFAHDHTQARALNTVGFYVNLEPPPAYPAFVRKNLGKAMRPNETTRVRKRKFPASLVQTLNSQTCAAFGAARADYRTTGTGFHAHAKSMRAFASRRRRLIGPFHVIRPVIVKSPLLQPLTPVSVNRYSILRKFSAE
jgi:hypothetical protein